MRHRATLLNVICGISLAALVAACGGGKHDHSSHDHGDGGQDGHGHAHAPAPGGEENRRVAQRARFTYRYTRVPGCDTYTRVALSIDELCLNLQVDAQNNQCARDDRKEHFDKVCEDQTWNPHEAEHRLAEAGEARITCELTDSDLPGQGYKLVQTMFGERMEMRHEAFAALITRSEPAEGELKLSVELHHFAGGEPTRAEKTWKLDDSEPEEMKLTRSGSGAIAVCRLEPRGGDHSH